MSLRRGLLISLVLVGAVFMFGCGTTTEETQTTSTETIPVVEETKTDVVESEDVETPIESEEKVEAVAEVAEETKELEEVEVVEVAEETSNEEVTLGILTPDVELKRDAPALDFALESVDGEVVQLSDYRGKLVLVNFWALT